MNPNSKKDSKEIEGAEKPGASFEPTDSGLDTSSASDVSEERPKKKESVRDTLMRVQKEQSSDDGSSDVEGGEPSRAPRATKKRFKTAEDKTAASSASSTTDASQDTASAPGIVSRLSGDLKKEYDALPPEAKKLSATFLTKLDKIVTSNYQRKAQELSNKERALTPLLQTISPELERHWALGGYSVADKVREWVAVEHLCDQNLASGLNWICEQYGTSLIDVVRSAARNAKPVDPALQGVHRKIGELESTIQSLTGLEESRRTASVEGEKASAYGSVNRFLQATNEDGSSMFPYVQKFWPLMMPKVAALREANPGVPHEAVLYQAYKDVESEVLGTVRPAIEAEVQSKFASQRDDKITRARRASTSLPPGGRVSGAAQGGSVRQILERNARSMGII